MQKITKFEVMHATLTITPYEDGCGMWMVQVRVFESFLSYGVSYLIYPETRHKSAELAINAAKRWGICEFENL